MNQEMNELLVPQIIVDLTKDYINNKNHVNADVYRQRIESIRDYCNYVLEQDIKTFSTNKNQKFRQKRKIKT